MGKSWAGQRNLEFGMPQRVESVEWVNENRGSGWLRNEKVPDEVTEIEIWDALEEGKHWAGQRNLEFGMSQRIESAERVNENRGSGWLRNGKELSRSTKSRIWDVSESRKCGASHLKSSFRVTKEWERAWRGNRNCGLGYPGRGKTLSRSTKSRIWDTPESRKC